MNVQAKATFSLQARGVGLNDAAGVAQRFVRHHWELYALYGATILLTAWIVQGNPLTLLPWLLGLLLVGITCTLLLPLPGAALAVLVGWVLVRQQFGVWTSATLVQSVVEIAGVTITLLLALLFAASRQRHQQELERLRSLQNTLLGAGAGGGLLAYDVAELRLHEEADRARAFERPLGLLLIEIAPVQGQALPEANELRAISAAVGRQLASVAQAHDIPFRASQQRLGLILPERTPDMLCADAEPLLDALAQARYLAANGQPHPVNERVALRCGLATYGPHMASGSDLLHAAEQALAAPAASMALRDVLREVEHSPISLIEARGNV